MAHAGSQRLFWPTVISSALFLLAFPPTVFFVTGSERLGVLMIVPLTLFSLNYGRKAAIIAALSVIVFTEAIYNANYFLIRHFSLSPAWLMFILAPALVFLFVGIVVGRFGETVRELRVVERSLSAAQETSRQYLDIAGVLLMVLDPERRILLMNRKGHDILGYGEGELIGKDYVAVCLPTRLRGEMAQTLGRLMTGDPGLEYHENPVITKSGEERLIAWHNTHLRDHAGKIVASLSSGEDITERRRAEEAFARSHAHLEAVLNALPDVMYEVDRRGVIYDVRTSHPDRLLYPQALSSVGRTVTEILPEDTVRKILSAIAQAGQNGEYKGFALEFTNDRETRWYELSVAAVGDHRAKDCHFVLLARDATERRRLEQQLIQSQKMEAVGRLSGGIAHDFNNILMVIMSYCDLIQRGSEDKQQVSRWVTIIKDSAGRAAALTHQLLAFSRKQILAPSIVDLDRLIEDMRPMLMKMLGENIVFVHDSGGDGNRVRADASQLQQVIMNLTVNARDAMPDEGRFSIAVRSVMLESSDPLRPTEVPPGPYVVMHVSDTGSGMDAETLAHLFEPFFTTKELGGGTGLGLSIVYGIVNQSDGYIFVESILGGGTTFRLYLPASHEAGDMAVGGPEKEQTGTETILLVEDEDDVRSLILQHLRGSGYTVMEAANGAEAAKLCQDATRAIHLLVTDIGLPGLKGWKIAESFLQSNPTGKIIYMTGYTDAVGLKELGSLTGAEILQKPFSMTELSARIRAVLDGQQPEA